MNSFQDFISWAGGTRKAAERLDMSASKVSRVANGIQPMTASIAEAVERVSDGVFRKEQVMWPEESSNAARRAR